MMLSQFALEYKPRPSIKAQALADFMVECTARDIETDQNSPQTSEWWEVSTDGSSRKKGAGAGIVVTTPEGFKAYYAILLRFSPTNNEAEYEALIAGLQRARQLGAKTIRAKTDSALVVGQVNGEFVTNGDKLMVYKDRVLAVLRQFEAHELTHIPRSDNADADMLSRLVHEAPEHISKIAHIEEAIAPCIDTLEVEPVGAEQDPWITDLKEYLQDGKMPEEADRARKVRLRAPRFQVVDDRLYRRSYGGPLMRCLNAFEADIVMKELHSGLCSAHQGDRSLARRIMVMGYYWPSIQLDCESLVRAREPCQKFAKTPGRPATFYQPISTAIPFARWGVDIIGPFLMLAGRKKFVIVAIDYFSKWIEAEPLATITAQQCARFVWRNVIARFRVPVHLITDNGRQFESQYFKNFLVMVSTKSIRSSVAYPQGNGQVENANRKILDGLKKKLFDADRSWANALEEKREVAARRIVEYQNKVKQTRDLRVRPRYFQVGDYVLRERRASRPNEGGKLAQTWEGPYVISVVFRPGTYKLETTTGKPVDRIWNSEHLVLFRH
ncbi:uncharacterized protein LOC116010757 [Ipomoea triloba]|uniref:uncharacterized protein LOC116010757 n=1 Tax=Ipomoea triloba TaxID=35885 RepID=UPI00125D25FF|nr:uncharacterized protein LOC116010757 [Ipomoea triloba]